MGAFNFIIMASKESIKGITNCIEYLTKQNWDISVIAGRIEEFISGKYNEIHFDTEGSLYFTRTATLKSLYELDGYRVWAYSEEEARSYVERIKKF